MPGVNAFVQMSDAARSPAALLNSAINAGVICVAFTARFRSRVLALCPSIFMDMLNRGHPSRRGEDGQKRI